MPTLAPPDSDVNPGDRPIVDLEQWISVSCSECGALRQFNGDEFPHAEQLQIEHSEDKRGHRVNVDLYYRYLAATRINLVPHGVDDPKSTAARKSTP